MTRSATQNPAATHRTAIAAPLSGSAPASSAVRRIRGLLGGETRPRRNLGTFSTTWAEPELIALLAEHQDRNLVNQAEYDQTNRLAQQCLTWLSSLWHGPAEPVGCSTSGSSEAVMLAGVALLRRWQHRASHQRGRPNLVLGTGAHTCWKRFCLLFDVTPRYVPQTGERLVLDPQAAAEACDSDTIGVVAVLGSTDFGCYDPVADLQTSLDDLHHRSGLDLGIHVDAASGGFVAPFLHPDTAWDFRLPRVQSINASGHKFGLTFPALGWLLWRSADALPGELFLHSPYIGGGVDTCAFTFSRPATQVIHQYYNLTRYGPAGYRTIHRDAVRTARGLGSAIADLGPYTLLTNAEQLPVITFTGNPADLGNLGRHLNTQGWHLPVYQPTPTSALHSRIVIRHGFTTHHSDQLLTDIRASSRSSRPRQNP